MSTEAGPCQKDLERMQVGNYAGDDSRFCLTSLRATEADSPELEEKRKDLLAGRIESGKNNSIEYVCNMGGCTLKLVESLENGSVETSGECRAANYCLKQKIKAVTATEAVEEGRALHRQILDEVGLVFGGGMAGSFCPRLECGYSFGCSEDQIYGSNGKCAMPESAGQLTLGQCGAVK